MSPSAKLALLNELNSLAHFLVRTWGVGLTGVTLIRRSLSGEPWASAEELAGATELSPSQVRRRLDELVAIGRVEVRQRGRAKYYKASKYWSEKTIARLVESYGGVALCNERFSK